MADWDADSPRFSNNLKTLLRALRDRAANRAPIAAAEAKTWHTDIMAGLEMPEPDYVGRFRGEPGLEWMGVVIGEHDGTPPDRVTDEITEFESRLQSAVDFMDQRIEPGTQPDAETLDAVVDICGWVHAEWVRIHPFANGNGRTARIWANLIAMRYGLPPFVRLRPRPEGNDYSSAGAQALCGDWRPTADLFRQMLDDFLSA